MNKKHIIIGGQIGKYHRFLDEKDAATISGYVIYKTQVWNAPNDVVLKTEPAYIH